MAFQLALGCQAVGYEFEHRSCKCCPYLTCYGGSSIEWIEISDLTACVTGADSIGRLMRTDASDFTNVSGDASSCFYDWTDTAADLDQISTWDFGPPIGPVDYRRGNNMITARFQSAANGTLDVTIYQVWNNVDGYTKPGFNSSIDRGTRTTLYRITDVKNLSGIYSLAKISEVDTWENAGTINTGVFPYCSTPAAVLAKFCKPPECVIPSCRCWDESEGSYRNVPTTAYLDVCGGTVLDADPGYTGCSNGAYFLACGPSAGPCWSLATNCGVNYSTSFGCNIAGITTPGGYIITFSYTASQVFYRLISYTNVDHTATNLMLACEITGSTTAETDVPTGCPLVLAPTCGFPEISKTVNYFTFPSGNINSRTVIDYATFLALAVDAYAPLCDYTAATVELDFS